MVVLRPHFAVLLVMLSSWGCHFEPAITGMGYQACETTENCEAGGFVCLKGFCVPDCQGAYPVAWLEPAKDGDKASVECSAEESCQINHEAMPSRLDVALPPGNFIEMGPEKTGPKTFIPDPGCGRVVLRFSVLAPDMDESQGLELSVVIRGQDATGVLPDNLLLRKVVEGEDIDPQFRENTQFYVVNTAIFEWPIRLRLVPIASNTVAYFAIRDFEISCCE